MYRIEIGGCSFVPVDVQARCDAARSWVQPGEVLDLARAIRREWGADWYKSGSVGQYLRWAFETGELSYFPDPPVGDLWCSPLDTLQVGGGDCDDLAILALSLLLAMGVNAYAAIGYVMDEYGNAVGHMWVEGRGVDGFFCLEATNGDVLEHRPENYVLMQRAHPNWCDARVA
jgi:hypothetical protein